MNEPTISLMGNLAADPELRFTPSGAAVANFTVIQTPRRFNRQTGEWTDGTPISMRCNVWRGQAENVAESLTRGTRVMVTGRLVQRSWDDRNSGETRYRLELEVDEIGASVKFATVKVTKAERQDTTAARQSGGDQGGAYDEPPF
jgi:single-strand DNA-binding protein